MRARRHTGCDKATAHSRLRSVRNDVRDALDGRPDAVLELAVVLGLVVVPA
jgi:hypothetical protein